MIDDVISFLKQFMWFVMLNYRFTDTDHWLKYFPPHAKSDLKALGVKVIIF